MRSAAAELCFFRLAVVLEFADFAGEFLLDLSGVLEGACGLGLGEVVFEEDFAFGDAGAEFGVDLGEGGFLFGGEFDCGSLFLEPFHGEFVCGFHQCWENEGCMGDVGARRRGRCGLHPSREGGGLPTLFALRPLPFLRRSC